MSAHNEHYSEIDSDRPTPSGSRRPSALIVRWLAPLGLLSLLAAACGDDKPLNTFEPRGPKAQLIDDLMRALVVVMLVVGFGVMLVVLYIVFKHRVNGDELDPEDLPEQVHGKPILEVLWTLAPGLLLAGVAVPTATAIWKLEEPNEPGELDVMVIGQQWWWEYRYDIDQDGFFADGNGDGVVDEKDERLPLDLALDPDDISVPNELVIPAGQQVDLKITSRDVIHSFWIPRLNGKRDAVPGRIHTWSIEADDPGKFTGWCTEFCGLSHARMRMSVIALEDADFEQWLANQAKPAEIPTDPDEVAGRELMGQLCVACHVINDGQFEYGADFAPNLESGVAPDLTHFASRSVYAGAIFSQYTGPGTDANDDALDESTYLQLADMAADADSPDDIRWDRAGLKGWVSNAPALKDMDPDGRRGMIAFPQLTDQQLDQIVAYLATLD